MGLAWWIHRNFENFLNEAELSTACEDGSGPSAVFFFFFVQTLFQGCLHLHGKLTGKGTLTPFPFCTKVLMHQSRHETRSLTRSIVAHLRAVVLRPQRSWFEVNGTWRRGQTRNVETNKTGRLSYPVRVICRAVWHLITAGNYSGLYGTILRGQPAYFIYFWFPSRTLDTHSSPVAHGVILQFVYPAKLKKPSTSLPSMERETINLPQYLHLWVIQLVQS